jgi:uncharacterized coiled-coil DUF342 family protein
MCYIESIEQKAIDFFRKETNTDQVIDASSLGIIKLMIMFSKSENSELESLNQELTESNLSLSNDVTIMESKIEELNQDILQSQNNIDELEAEVKQKQDGIDKLMKSCEDIQLQTLKFVSEYENLMNMYQASQVQLREVFKKGLSVN